jgi:hypothetical protein
METKGVGRSIHSLLGLAAIYGVSPEAMMSRLRFLRLWGGDLQIWRREATGDFVLDRMIGGKWFPWRWSDKAIPADAWVGGLLSGHSYLEYEVRPGYKHVKSMSFDAKREGSTLMVLSGVSDRRQPRSIRNVGRKNNQITTIQVTKAEVSKTSNLQRELSWK